MEDFYNYFKSKYNVDLSKCDDEILLSDIFCLVGQEGVDFLDDFLINFNIYVEKVDYKDHFISDGVGFGFKKFMSKTQKSLKIKHLVNSYLTKEWTYFE